MMNPFLYRIFLGCAALLGPCVLASAASTIPSERATIKLLTIGNSFAENPTDYLPSMAKAGGKELILFRANLSGAPLQLHAKALAAALADPADPEGSPYKNNPVLKLPGKTTISLPAALSAQAWDIVTIQQASLHSFRPETYQPHADRLVEAIRRYAPTAEIVVQETWAYRGDHEIYRKGDGFTPAVMYSRIRDTYRAFADAKGFRIIPTGDAFDIALHTSRWTYVPDPAFDFKKPPEGALPADENGLFVGWDWKADKQTGARVFLLDGKHSSTAGKYLGAAVWYQVLFNTSDVPADYRPGALMPEDAADLRAHARAAVQAERARSASTSTRPPTL